MYHNLVAFPIYRHHKVINKLIFRMLKDTLEFQYLPLDEIARDIIR